MYKAVVVKLIRLPKTKYRRLLENSPQANKNLPVYAVTYTSNMDKLKQAKTGDFSSWRGNIKKHGSEVIEISKGFEKKLDCLLHREQLVSKYSKHPLFFYNPEAYTLYVVNLDKKVWEYRGFKKQNNDKLPTNGCYLYVGQTSKTAEERFKIHKSKKNGKPHPDSSKKIVHPHGKSLNFELMKKYTNENKYTELNSLLMEKKLATDLRKLGYATYYN